MTSCQTYLMESRDEAIRLDVKTDPEAVRRQALWCGIAPGQRILDVGCGSGRASSILHEMVQPGGSLLGLDFSPQRIAYAKEHYGKKPGIDFRVQDLTLPPEESEEFDVIWIRFFLEYYRRESLSIVRNFTEALKRRGFLCLIDLDYNCLSHYELPSPLDQFLPKLLARLDGEYNFDAFAGRKLYSYLYDLKYEQIQVELMAHHLIYGPVRDADLFNWMKKIETIAAKSEDLFVDYPGGHETFLNDVKRFFCDPRRFTYTPLILCKGMRPSGG